MSEPRPSTPVVALHPGRRPRPEPLWRHLVGAVLRDERRNQGRTLRDVADRAGISVPYLSEVERGRKEASSEILMAAAGALGLGLADLLARGHELLAGREVQVLAVLTPGPQNCSMPTSSPTSIGPVLLAA
jgi:transcriptional regulator with XRE-family HTH domain